MPRALIQGLIPPSIPEDPIPIFDGSGTTLSIHYLQYRRRHFQTPPTILQQHAGEAPVWSVAPIMLLPNSTSSGSYCIGSPFISAASTTTPSESTFTVIFGSFMLFLLSLSVIILCFHGDLIQRPDSKPLLSPPFFPSLSHDW